MNSDYSKIGGANIILTLLIILNLYGVSHGLKLKPEDVEEMKQLSGGRMQSIDYFPGFNFSKVSKPDTSKKRCHFVQQVILAVIKEHLPLHHTNKTLKEGIQISSDGIVSFYRVSGALYYHDLFSSKKYSEWGFSNARTRCFVCGNLLPSSFGTYRNAKNQLVYGITSYDDTLIGDYQLDVWRLAIALVNQASTMHYSRNAQEDLVNKFTRSYYKAIHAFSSAATERSLLFTRNNTYGKLHRFLIEAERHSTKHAKVSFIKHMAPGGHFHHLKLLNTTKERQNILNAWPSYIQRAAEKTSGYYKIKDIRRLRTPRDGYMVLIQGKSSKNYDDVLLQVKRVHNPAWLSAAPKDITHHVVNNYKNFAKRIITGNLALDIQVDPHLGWFKMGKNVYIVREFGAARQSLHSNEYMHRHDFQKISQQWGTVLATFHARSDNDFRRKFIGYSFEKNLVKVIGRRLDRWQKSVLRVAFGYHRQVVSDYRCMKKYSRKFLGRRSLRASRKRPHGPRLHHKVIHHKGHQPHHKLIHHHRPHHHTRHARHVHHNGHKYRGYHHKSKGIASKKFRHSKKFLNMKRKLYRKASKKLHKLGKKTKYTKYRAKRGRKKRRKSRKRKHKYSSARNYHSQTKKHVSMDLNEDETLFL